MALLDILVGNEPNDGLGDDLRTGAQKVNQNFDNVLNLTGGASYIDGTYTVASPLAITQGTRVKLTCDNTTVVDGNVPIEFTAGMWDATTNKLLAVNNKDRIILEVRFKAKSTLINSYFDIEIDIGGTQNVISSESKTFTRSANVEQTFKTVFMYFTGLTFIENGGDIFINAVNGNLEIYDINLVITRVHKGRA